MFVKCNLNFDKHYQINQLTLQPGISIIGIYSRFGLYDAYPSKQMDDDLLLVKPQALIIELEEIEKTSDEAIFTLWIFALGNKTIYVSAAANDIKSFHLLYSVS